MDRITLVPDLLRSAAQKRPDKLALITDTTNLTYGSLEARSNKVARAFRSLGLRRGERALILLPNNADAVITFFGIMKVGAIACILHYSTKQAKLAQIVQDSGASLIVTDLAHIAVAASDPAVKCIVSTEVIPETLDVGPSVYSLPALLYEFEEASFDVGAVDQDIAFLVYTSGSTGSAKGVMCPHISVISAIHSITQYLKNTSHDTVVNLLPLAFDHGLYQAMTMFYVGGTLLLEKDFTVPYASVRRMKEAHITGLPGVPTIFAILLRLRLAPDTLPELRYLASTGASWPVQHIHALQAIFPHASIYSMYGLTECKRVSYLPPEELLRRPTSIGRGMPNEELWLVDHAGQRLGPNQVGELVVRGTNVMRGYWNRPDETDEVFRPGAIYGERVLYTGDLMLADEEGFLYYVGRRDDLIKSRGEKVYPKEVEEVLYSIPGITEAVVVGEPHSVYGEAVIAHVVLTPGMSVSPEEVIDFCASKLEDAKVPLKVCIHAVLPRTSSGKIDRRALKETLKG